MDRTPTNLYPERPIDSIDAKITELSQLDSGDGSFYEISDTERSALLERESELSSRLEGIYAVTPQNAVIHPEYLFTADGRAEFAELCNSTVPEFSDLAEVQAFLFDKQSSLAAVPAKQRQAFEGRTRNFVEGKIKEELLAAITKTGDLEVDEIENPHFFTIRLTPELTLQKLDALRAFKAELKQMLIDVDPQTESEKVWGEMLKLYLKRINSMLADLAQAGLAIKHKEAAGVVLSDVEKALLVRVFEVGNSDRVAARYDKFQHGAAAEADVTGNYRQISETLADFAETKAEIWKNNVKQKAENIAAAGLDGQKLKEAVYDREYIKTAAEEVLASYDLLSDESSETFDPEREGPAQDNKWQVIVSDAYGVMGVDSKQKIVKIPAKNQTPTSLFSITLAHEIEGHVLQHENKEKIGMHLYQRVGSEGSSMFAEGGAMMNQDYVSKAAFNYASSAHAHYVRAMLAKHEGGTYLDCVKAFYDSAREPHVELLAEKKIDQAEYIKRCKTAVRLAVNRTRRLFRNGGDYGSSEASLTNSQPTAYLEQIALQEKLKEHGMPHYLLLSGVNAEALVFLRKAGFMNPGDIQLPTYKSLEMWETEKENFLNTGSESAAT